MAGENFKDSCPSTLQKCSRGCAFGQCKIRNLKQPQAAMEIQQGSNYFIPSHRLGAIEGVATSMLSNANKRSRRVDLNHIQQVLKTLKLIPHSVKVISIGLGCLDTGESGLLVLCTSPTQVQGDIP